MTKKSQNINLKIHNVQKYNPKTCSRGLAALRVQSRWGKVGPAPGSPGPVPDQPWASPGPALGQPWTSLGTALGPPWANPGPALDSGLALDRPWVSRRPGLARANGQGKGKF